jgi:nucleotide-binding universal stress UspA family protein
MKKILVPTDFSNNAQKAVDYAVAIAEKADAEIILLNALAVVDTTFSSRKAVFEEYNNSLAADMREQLKDLQQTVEKKSTVKITTKFFKGSIADSILKCAVDEDVNLIVMGTRGASGIERMLWGSTTACIIGNTTIPVLAIPRGAEWKGLKNILFAIRHFEADDKTLIPILKLAQLEAALVHVAVFTDTDDNDLADYIEHGRLLNAYKQTLPARYKDVQFKTEHLEGKEFEDTIEQYIKGYDIDMLVMTTHKRSFWNSMFNRSMTKSMAYQINIPLLAIPV